MEVTSMRQKLHQYIDKSDDKLLKLMYALAKEYNGDDDFEFEFTAAEIQGFEQRREQRLSGTSETYNWNDAKDIITGKKK
ncbi:hypothetical protein [Deminuibacter soli]|uniref:Addiction module family protein n=1 Tax=Deminuibacter soli TaxID=2291815 RepID=A0A3E1NMB3_9BACT|nr:hypothetical protein [Deminuibacter soli]RFM29052.1 hypothetical protein DXN05_09840 [Deminuibacter soli]